MLKSSTYASHTMGRSPVGSLHPPRSLVRFENGMVMGLLVLTLLGFVLGLRDRGGRALLCFVLGATFVVSGV